MDTDYKIWIGVYSIAAVMFLGANAKVSDVEISNDLRNAGLNFGNLETKAVVNQREELIPRRNKPSKHNPYYI